MDIKLKLSHNLCFKFCLWYFVLIFGKEWPLNNESAIVLSLPENTNSYICVYLLSQGLSLSIREYASNPPLELLNSTPYLPPPPPLLSPPSPHNFKLEARPFPHYKIWNKYFGFIWLKMHFLVKKLCFLIL